MVVRKQSEDTQDTLRRRCYASYVSAFKSSGEPALSIEHKGYRHWLEARYGVWLRDLPSSSPVLDLGCGSGDMLCFLNQQGFTEAEGIDISAQQVEQARARGCSVTLADAFETLPRHTEHYAAILALDFLEHFTREELPALLALIHNALKKEGILIIKTPNGTSPFAAEIVHDDLTHASVFGPASLSHLLHLSGFRDIQITESSPVPYGLKSSIRAILWAVVRWSANTLKRIESGRTQPVWSENMICCCRKGAEATP